MFEHTRHPRKNTKFRQVSEERAAQSSQGRPWRHHRTQNANKAHPIPLANKLTELWKNQVENFFFLPHSRRMVFDVSLKNLPSIPWHV